MSNVNNKEIIDLFDADLCSTSSGREQRTMTQIKEVDELMNPLDELIQFINKEINN